VFFRFPNLLATLAVARSPFRQSTLLNAEISSVGDVVLMEQHFFVAVAPSADDVHSSLTDENGVALAAIEELYQSNLAKDRPIDDLKAANADRLARIGKTNASNTNPLKRINSSKESATPLASVGDQPTRSEV